MRDKNGKRLTVGDIVVARPEMSPLDNSDSLNLWYPFLAKITVQNSKKLPFLPFSPHIYYDAVTIRTNSEVLLRSAEMELLPRTKKKFREAFLLLKLEDIQ